MIPADTAEMDKRPKRARSGRSRIGVGDRKASSGRTANHLSAKTRLRKGKDVFRPTDRGGGGHPRGERRMVKHIKNLFRPGEEYEKGEGKVRQEPAGRKGEYEGGKCAVLHLGGNLEKGVPHAKLLSNSSPDKE